MRFKDAAYEILKKVGKQLHYREITALAMEAKILDTVGLTPDASMGALLYTDTLKPDSRFRRGDQRGTFALRMVLSGNIDQQFQNIQTQVRKELKKHLLKIDPSKFEELIRILLEEMGFEETGTTPYSNDKGVDVRGVLRSNPLSEVKIAIQAKRWSKNVGSDVVRDLRGSLRVADSEQGLIITPSSFTAEAKKDSKDPGRTPIRLIDGEQLVDLLIQYKVGVKLEEYVVPTIDNEYWSEILGVIIKEGTPEPERLKKTTKKDKPTKTPLFPLKIQALYKGQTYEGLLVNVEGEIMWNGSTFPTPSNAAKAIVEWKTVNGWDFWKYWDEDTKKWEKIGNLREK